MHRHLCLFGLKKQRLLGGGGAFPLVMEAANPGTYKIESSPEGAAEGRAHVVCQQEESAEGRVDRWRQGRPSDPSSTGIEAPAFMAVEESTHTVLLMG